MYIHTCMRCVVLLVFAGKVGFLMGIIRAVLGIKAFFGSKTGTL